MIGSEFSLVAAFLAGLIGSVHCIGMCGGIVGMLTAAQSKVSSKAYIHWVLYHCGRIFSYSIAGFIAGLAGGQVYDLFPPDRASELGAMISGAFIILLGIHAAGWWRGLEILGGALWKKVSPVLLRVIPPRAWKHSLLAGMVWGWLPCGLVYSTLVLTVASGSGYGGMLIMLAFGAGTLPMLVGMTIVSDRLSNFHANSRVRGAFGAVLCGLGTLIFLGLLPLHPMENHHLS